MGKLGRMTSAEDYRRYAAECVALAQRLPDPNDKARLLEMAQAFLDMANRQARQETNRTDE